MVSLSRWHLQFYSSPYNINYTWIMGFLLYYVIQQQIISGILLATQYTSDINHSYSSIQYLGREVYYGWCLHYLHSSGVSFIFGLILHHIGRGLYVSSYQFRTSFWLSGIALFLLHMMTAFLGYILSWGQLSFWGGTVISNLVSTCSITTFICGGSMICNPTLKRFFIFHLLLPLIISGLSVVHLFYLHYICSSNTLGFYTNNFITFYPIIMFKDILGLIGLLLGYTLQIFVSYGLSHPDNILEVNSLITPLHIVPEWYFLHLYMVLKAIPNKTSGLLIFVSICINLCLFNEVKNISTITVLTSSYNWIYGNLCNVLFVINTIHTFNLGGELISIWYTTSSRTLISLNTITLGSNLQ